MVCRCDHLTDFSAYHLNYRGIDDYKIIPGFYEEYDPLEFWYASLGFIVSIIICPIHCATFSYVKRIEKSITRTTIKKLRRGRKKWTRMLAISHGIITADDVIRRFSVFQKKKKPSKKV